MVFGALVFKLSVWCGAEGYVSDKLKTKAPNTTGINHLYNTYRAPDDGHNGAPKHVEKAIRSAIKIICSI